MCRCTKNKNKRDVGEGDGITFRRKCSGRIRNFIKLCPKVRGAEKIDIICVKLTTLLNFLLDSLPVKTNTHEENPSFLAIDFCYIIIIL